MTKVNLPSSLASASGGIAGNLPVANGTGNFALGGSRSSATPLTDGLLLTDSTTQTTNHTFNFGPRTATALAYPVPTIQPKTAGLNLALDIAPSQGATGIGTNGYAWIDICDAPVIDAGAGANAAYAGTSLRLSNQHTFGEVSTRTFSGTTIPLYIGSNYPGTGNPQIYLSPMSGSYPALILGYDGSDVFSGVNAAIATTATKGFFFPPVMAGAPTGTPHYTSQPAVVLDSTNNKLWAYLNGAWKGVTLS